MLQKIWIQFHSKPVIFNLRCRSYFIFSTCEGNKKDNEWVLKAYTFSLAKFINIVFCTQFCIANCLFFKYLQWCKFAHCRLTCPGLQNERPCQKIISNESRIKILRVLGPLKPLHLLLHPPPPSFSSQAHWS